MNHYKLENIEEFELEIKELINFKEVSNVKVNNLFHLKLEIEYDNVEID